MHSDDSRAYANFFILDRPTYNTVIPMKLNLVYSNKSFEMYDNSVTYTTFDNSYNSINNPMNHTVSNTIVMNIYLIVTITHSVSIASSVCSLIAVV